MWILVASKCVTVGVRDLKTKELADPQPQFPLQLTGESPFSEAVARLIHCPCSGHVLSRVVASPGNDVEIVIITHFLRS
jgi:hypothetical protein